MKESTVQRQVYAKKDEVICCSMGHPLAKFKRDVFCDDESVEDDFEFLVDSETDHCPTCAEKPHLNQGELKTDGLFYFKEEVEKPYKHFEVKLRRYFS